ncbi:MAG: amidohydrolase family protein, partial [Bacteroidales bacterium]|nr:amidohydrolase family protein [Bacteroidales bacterium]
MRKIILKYGKVYINDILTDSDVVISGSKISAIEKDSTVDTQDQVIDCSGKFIFPGGIDPHVHMHLPTPAGFSSDNFETGSRAAIAGGTTS